MTFEDKIEFIHEYAMHEGCEIGEYWDSIIQFCQYSLNGVSNGLKKAFIKEVNDIYKDIQENYEIVVDEREEIVKIRDVYLKHKGE